MILGNANYSFSFTVNGTNIPVKDNINLLGVNIDKNLHVKNKKVNNQIFSKDSTHRYEMILLSRLALLRGSK